MNCSEVSYNNLQSNSFTMTIERIPQTIFRVTKCSVPSVQIPPPEVAHPGAPQYFPGSVTVFDSLTIEFLIDEDLKNYEEMFNWITQQRFLSDVVPNLDGGPPLVSDGAIITMNNNSAPNKVFSFKNLFPVSLGSLNFDTTVDQPTSVVCEAEFRFSYFVMKNV